MAITEPVVTESDRLLAEGVEIELRGGERARLVIDFIVVKRFEDTFGSLGAATSSIGQEPMFSHLLRLLSIVLDVPEDELLPKLVSKNVGQYLNAFNEALAQGLPEPSPEDKASPNAEAVESNGAPSTTSQPSDSAAPTSNSGE
jgi:hypothetical protein